MIKTKLFTGYFEDNRSNRVIGRKFIDIDTEINEFLYRTNAELIDVKYAVSVMDGESWNSALMIYKM